MTLSRDRIVDEALVERLLARQAREQQASLLRREGLLDRAGLDRLLDLADGMAGSDPNRAHRLADLCARVADLANAPVAVPRSDYVRLKAHAENGEFGAALGMAGSAHDGYVALGLNLEALRTHVGRMWVLLELGRYEEALDTGQAVLHALGGEGGLDVTAGSHERDLLTALVHQNRGVCYEYMGRYDRALDAYATAEERYRELGDTRRVGEILDNRGGVLLRLGRGKEALAAHEAAAEIFERAGLTLAYAGALENIGETHLRLANYVRGLDTLERARRLFGSLGALAGEDLLLLDIADAYLELNLYSEALVAYEEVNERLRTAEGIEGALPHERAQALWGMGSALIALSDLKEAGRALRGAADKFAAAGNAPMLSGVMLEQASLLAARGDKEGALSTARRALGIVSERDYPVQRVYAHLRLSDLLLPDHREEETEKHLLAAQRLSHSLALPHLRYRLDERLGRLRRLQGRDEEARVLLEAAVGEIERLRGAVAHESMRASFLRDKTAAYEDLLLLYLARDGEDGTRRAFEVAEKAKSRALTDLITGVVERAPVTSTDPTRDRRLRGLQADLNATYNEMLGVDGEGVEAPTQNLQERAVELEAEISRLSLQAAPAADLFLTPNAAEDDALERFPSDTTLLAYHVVGDEILAFVGAKDDVGVVRNLGSVEAVSELLQRLSIHWDRFRAGPEFVARHAAMLERSTREILGHLYTALVAPLEPLLEKARRETSNAPGAPPKLAVVPHGPLHQVPFHALPDGERYLIERFEISYAPSARVYALCQQRGRRESEEALVVSVPDPLIPAVTEEAHTVARHFPDAEVLNHEGATTTAIKVRSSGRAVLHLACHGLFRPDNPMFSSLRLHDGWLTAADVLRLDLAGTLVTLSACESGRSEVVGGDEILGLTRAFLGAGASSLVASLWLVQDETTASLMEKYYERLRAGSDPAEALRVAQLALKEKFPHPYYWAPFVVLGRR